ncbi:MAG: MFS transporter [Candidatus Hodarchaeales archaeon]|jgi:MFS family permease
MYTSLHSILGIKTLNPEAKSFITKAVSLIFIYTFSVMLTNTFLILFALDFLTLPELSIILALQAVVQAMSDYPTGAIGDWIGQRWILFIAAVSYGIGFIVLSQAHGFISISIPFILIAFARSQESGAFISWLDNNYKFYVPEDDDKRMYSRFFGKFTMLHEIIYAVSFIVGGIAVFYFDRSWMFLFQGISLVLISVLFLFLVRDHKSFTREKPEFKRYFHYLGGGVLTVTRNKTLRLMVLGLIISGTGFAVWGGLILFPLYEGYAKSDSMLAILRSTIFIASAVCTGIAGSVSVRIHNTKKWLSIGILSTDVLFFLGMFVMMVINPVPTTLNLMSLGLVILFFTFGFTPRYLADVLRPRFYLDVIPDYNRNAIYSLIPTAILVVSIFAIPVGGYLIETVGLEYTILILAFNGLLGSSLTAWAIYTHKIEEKFDDEISEICCPIFPSKMTDTQEIIPQTVPCCWSFDPVTAYVWSQLKETVLEDNIFSEEEIILIEKIMFTVKEYGKILEEAVSKGIIDKTQQDQLENARNRIWIEAHNLAVRSDGLSEEVQGIFAVLKKVMNQLETKSIFRI